MDQLEIFLRLLSAAFFGLFIGSERTLAGKVAGMRTYALVSMGSAMFIIISLIVTDAYLGKTNFDPMRTLAAIISGVGFIGAGLIVMRDKLLRGLTSAAGLWVAAAVGAASGFGLYELSFFASVLTVLIFTAIWFVEHGIKNWWTKNGKSNKNVENTADLNAK